MTRPHEQLRDDLYRRFSPYGVVRQKLRRTLRLLRWWFIIVPLTSAKRALDIVIALLLLILTSPLYVLCLVTGGIPYERTPRVGRWGVIFNELTFRPRPGPCTWFRYLPLLVNILRGDISFVGPRRLSPDDPEAASPAAARRANVRPGLICLWWIRSRSNIAYSDELTTDSEYVETHSLAGDIGIALRAVPAILYGQGVQTAPDVVSILDIPLTNITMAEAVSRIVSHASQGVHTHVCFVNADCVNIACRRPAYLDILQHAECVLADGIGVKLAGTILQCDIKQNVNGTDLFPRLCAAMEGTPLRLFLLGAREGVADSVAEWIAANHPGVVVCGVHHGYFSTEEETDVLRRIAQTRPDIILVAFGAPRQDIWLAEHLEDTGASVGMGVGGLFDFYSGRIPRAPMWMREIGMEWLFRFLQEPRRMWRRYFVGNAVFLGRVIIRKLFGSSSPSHATDDH